MPKGTNKSIKSQYLYSYLWPTAGQVVTKTRPKNPKLFAQHVFNKTMNHDLDSISRHRDHSIVSLNRIFSYIQIGTSTLHTHLAQKMCACPGQFILFYFSLSPDWLCFQYCLNLWVSSKSTLQPNFNIAQTIYKLRARNTVQCYLNGAIHKH